VNVACVYRSGGDFTAADVAALRRGVSAHLPLPHRFVCLTDRTAEVDALGMDIDAVALSHDWRGWWAKMCLFGFPFDGPTLYFDMDTVIVGDPSEFASYTGPLAMLSDFYRPDFAESGVMAFTPGPVTDAVWRAFVANPTAAMRSGGDGKFIRAQAPSADRLQSLYPGQLVSYKVHCLPKGGVPAGARVVCFHGKPRPSSLPADHWVFG
jgi:hypothetical protein